MSFAFRIPLPATSRLLAAALILSASACKKNKDTSSAPSTVTFTQAALYPEGMEYDSAGQRYWVSSITKGAIGQVKDNNTYALFADDPQLISTVGLQLDASRNRLLVAVGDAGASTRSTAATRGLLAAMATFDANTGQRISYVDLGALRPGQYHYANDITFDSQGNYYVTDSFSPIIYKVDAQGTPSVFFESSQLATEPGKFGFNGIVYHPDGYLLTVHSEQSKLYKVPLNNPTAFAAVTVSQNLAGADGILLQDNQHLLVACNSQSTVVRLGTTDNWNTAAPAASFATGAVFPTSLAQRGNAGAYVLYSHLDALLGAQIPPASQYSITKVTF